MDYYRRGTNSSILMHVSSSKFLIEVGSRHKNDLTIVSNQDVKVFTLAQHVASLKSLTPTSTDSLFCEDLKESAENIINNDVLKVIRLILIVERLTTVVR